MLQVFGLQRSPVSGAQWEGSLAAGSVGKAAGRVGAARKPGSTERRSCKTQHSDTARGTQVPSFLGHQTRYQEGICHPEHDKLPVPPLPWAEPDLGKLKHQVTPLCQQQNNPMTVWPRSGHTCTRFASGFVLDFSQQRTADSDHVAPFQRGRDPDRDSGC